MRIFSFLKQKNKKSEIPSISYLPEKGIKINNVELKWNSTRKENREKLKLNYRVADLSIDVSENTENKNKLKFKRDIYKNCFSNNDLFNLNYDKNDRLIEIEVHYGYKININDINIEFGKDISLYINKLINKGFEYIEYEKGNFLFTKLKFSIANNYAMGGDDNNLAYFYCAVQIKHLLEK